MGRALLLLRVVLHPPVGARLDVIGTPHLVANVPLRRQHEIIVALLLPVALLPFAAVGEGHVLGLERDERIRRGEVRDDRLRVLLRILHDVGHQRGLPPVVDALGGSHDTPGNPRTPWWFPDEEAARWCRRTNWRCPARRGMQSILGSSRWTTLGRLRFLVQEPETSGVDSSTSNRDRSVRQRFSVL